VTSSLRKATLCFSCPSGDEPEAIELPEPNPWPQLVQADHLGYFRCQPIVKLVYTPNPILERFARLDLPARPTEADRERAVWVLKDRLSWMHENVHLVILSHSPVKDLARENMAYGYDTISVLSQASGRNDLVIGQMWSAFRRINLRVAKSFEVVDFVEELIATAFAIRLQRGAVEPGEYLEAYRDEFDVATKLFLADHAPELVRGYKRVLPLVDFIDGDPKFYSEVMPLVQPLEWRKDRLVAADATAQLYSLVDDLVKASSRRARMKLVRDRRAHFDPNWRIAVKLQQENAAKATQVAVNMGYRYGPMARRLLDIGLSDQLYDRIKLGGPVKDVENKYPSPHSSMSLINIRRHRGRSVFGWQNVRTDNCPPDETPTTPSLEATYWLLAFMEALRQQICVRRGIFCPFSAHAGWGGRGSDGSRRCQCPATMRAGLDRLADLGKAGLFGAGDWNSPPCQP
jgi:hypothetical protein